MSYNLALGDVIEVTFQGSMFAQVSLNIRHYVLTTIVAGTNAQVKFDNLNTYMHGVAGIVPKMRACASDKWRLENIVYQRIKPQRNARYVKLAGFAGTDVSGCKTANVSAAITLQTDLATKRGQTPARGQTGTWHQPAVPSGAQLDGELNGAYVIALDDLGAKLKDVIVTALGDEFTPVIFHREGTDALTWADPVTHATTQFTVRTQRTRTVGKGI